MHRLVMVFGHPPKEKTDFLPPVRVSAEQRERYLEAARAWCAEQGPRASWSDYVRALLEEDSRRKGKRRG